MRTPSPSHASRRLIVPLAALALAGLPAHAEEAKSAEVAVTGVVGGTHVSGSESAQREQTGIQGDIYGGIDELTIRGENGPITADFSARFIADENDYAIRGIVRHADLGSLSIDLRGARTWYNGVGGQYIRPNGTLLSLQPYDPSLYIDRDQIKVALTLQKGSDLPKAILTYEHSTREGHKNSTSWGDSNLVGITGATRNVVPTFYAIQEQRDRFTLSGEHAVGAARFGLGGVWETRSSDNSKNIRRRPTEAQDRYVTQKEGYETDLWAVHGFAEYTFNKKLKATTGAIYTSLDGQMTGDRIYGAAYDAAFDPAFARRQVRDHGFLDMLGTYEMKQFVWNAGLLYTPTKNWAIQPSVRYEHFDQHSDATLEDTEVNSSRVTLVEAIEANSRKGFNDMAGELEVRYTGLANWLFYGTGHYSHADGDLEEVSHLEETGAAQIDRLTDFTRTTTKAALGTNWNAGLPIRFAAQVYYKNLANDYTGVRDNTPPSGGDRYPGYVADHSRRTVGGFIRGTWRIRPNFTSITRVDLQKISVDSTAVGGRTVNSADHRVILYTESLSWMPAPRWYIQLSGTLADDRETTPAVFLTGPAAGEVQAADNDYWNADLSVTYILSEQTDLSVGATYYRADNFVPNYSLSLPFGAGDKQLGGRVTLHHRFSDKVLLVLQYGYLKWDDETSLGVNDFTAQAVSSKLQFRF